MRKFFLILRLFYNLIKVSKSPENTAAILEVGNCLWKLGLLPPVIERLKKDPKCLDYFNRRHLLPDFNMDELARLPEGTVGRAYSDHMTKNQLKPDFYKKMTIESDATYFLMRMRETHDLYHAVTGFGTDVPAELGLQAFTYGQVRTPLSALLVGSGIVIAIIKRPQEIPQLLDAITTGWKMGRDAACIFAFDWEKNWSLPLQEFSQQTQIKAI